MTNELKESNLQKMQFTWEQNTAKKNKNSTKQAPEC